MENKNNIGIYLVEILLVNNYKITVNIKRTKAIMPYVMEGVN